MSDPSNVGFRPPSAGPGEATPNFGVETQKPESPKTDRADASPNTPVSNQLSSVNEFFTAVAQQSNIKSLAGLVGIVKTGAEGAAGKVSELASKVSSFISEKFTQLTSAASSKFEKATSTTDVAKFKQNVLEHLADKKNESAQAGDRMAAFTFQILISKVATSDSKTEIENALKSEGYKLPSTTREMSKTTLSDRIDSAKEAFQELKTAGQYRLNQVLHAEENKIAKTMRDEVLSVLNMRNEANPSMELGASIFLIENATRKDGSIDSGAIKDELKRLNQKLPEDRKIGQRFLTEELKTDWKAGTKPQIETARTRADAVKGEKVTALMLAKEEMLRNVDQNIAIEVRAAADGVSFFDDTGNTLSADDYKNAVRDQINHVTERASELELAAMPMINDFENRYTPSELREPQMVKILAELSNAHTFEGSLLNEKDLEANLKEIMNRAPLPKDRNWAAKAEKRTEDRLNAIKNEYIKENSEIDYLFNGLSIRDDSGKLKSQSQLKEELELLRELGENK